MRFVSIQCVVPSARPSAAFALCPTSSKLSLSAPICELILATVVGPSRMFGIRLCRRIELHSNMMLTTRANGNSLSSSASASAIRRQHCLIFCHFKQLSVKCSLPYLDSLAVVPAQRHRYLYEYWSASSPHFRLASDKKTKRTADRPRAMHHRGVDP